MEGKIPLLSVTKLSGGLAFIAVWKSDHPPYLWCPRDARSWRTENLHSSRAYFDRGIRLVSSKRNRITEPRHSGSHDVANVPLAHDMPGRMNFLHKLLPSANPDSDCLLAKIDWYGDTYFNYLQMKQFIVGWSQLARRAQTPEEQALVSGIRGLAMRCETDRDLLRFIGD
jgi:hypothetical protein